MHVFVETFYELFHSLDITHNDQLLFFFALGCRERSSVTSWGQLEPQPNFDVDLPHEIAQKRHQQRGCSG